MPLGLIFEMLVARFYVSVEATESASHLTNRERTSYELKVYKSMSQNTYIGRAYTKLSRIKVEVKFPDIHALMENTHKFSHTKAEIEYQKNIALAGYTHKNKLY